MGFTNLVVSGHIKEIKKKNIPTPSKKKVKKTTKQKKQSWTKCYGILCISKKNNKVKVIIVL